MEFRKATGADEGELRKLLYHAISVRAGEAMPAPEIVEKPELARYVSGWGTREGDRGVVAEDEGVVVGSAWLRRWCGADRGYGFVDEGTPELSIAVVPERRGEGLGTELLRRVLEEAAKYHGGVSLSVAEHNEAVRLYKRFGFVRVGASGDSMTMLLEFGQRARTRE